MRNALTIDLEDYFHVSAFRDNIRPDDWKTLPSRIERNTDLLLALLEAANCKATFFTLGWVAEHHAEVVRRVASFGHEIACHSQLHRKVFELTPAEFRADTLRAKQLLEGCSGKAVKGYRAPSFSITENSLWALEILAELEFSYDSSIFPVHHPSYGMPAFSRGPRRIETPSGSIVEFPMTTLEFVGRRSPFGGGAYFRLLPYWYTRWGIQFLNVREERPVCVYLHPWELDSEQPRMKGSLTARVRHYIGLGNATRKFRDLTREFEFCPLGELLSSAAIT